MGAKKFDTSLETREIKLFGRDIPGFFAGISRGCPKKSREKSLCSISVPQICEAILGDSSGEGIEIVARNWHQSLSGRPQSGRRKQPKDEGFGQDLPSPKGPKIEKINLDWNFQSRLKKSISIEIFNPGPSEFPTKIRVWWVARLKILISIENFNPGGRSWFFSIFGPLREDLRDPDVGYPDPGPVMSRTRTLCKAPCSESGRGGWKTQGGGKHTVNSAKNPSPKTLLDPPPTIRFPPPFLATLCHFP